MQNYWLPTVRAAIALQRHDTAKAIAILRTPVPYELADPPPFSAGTMYPVYLRGQAYLSSGNSSSGSGNGELAAAEFQNRVPRRDRELSLERSLPPRSGTGPRAFSRLSRGTHRLPGFLRPLEEC
jgi:hypothetical protein